MLSPASASKRARAAAFPPVRDAQVTTGLLHVLWDRTFDRLCYQFSAPELPTTDQPRYTALRQDLTAGTGCTEDELLAHGSKVRGILFFAEDHLARRGALESLIGTQQHRYRLHPVTPEF